MTKPEWLEIVKKVRGNWKDFCDEENQFETFYEALSPYGAEEVLEAARRIIRQRYAYPPLVANFIIQIQLLEEEEKAKTKTAERAKNIEQAGESNDSGWVAFTAYLLKRKKPWPPTLAEAKVLKQKFEQDRAMKKEE